MTTKTEVKFENGIALYIDNKKVASIQQIYEPEIAGCFGLNESVIAIYIDKERCKNNPELLMEVVMFLLEYRRNWVNTRLFSLFKREGLTNSNLLKYALNL